ncbi:MAG: FAD-dependent monooxygenase [Candidatus Diapherotrites archaeon]|nr:FAD-dependent monooxygenase [Candidatus Diapherotrites archaeon]
MINLNLTEISDYYDVVIIGAGPAGCSSAKNLSEELKAIIIDSNKLPREKPCGGILVKEAMNFIKNLKPPEKIFVEPKEIKIEYIDLNKNEKFFSNEKYWNIDRKEFDKWLLYLAKENKIDVCDNTFLLDFYYSKKGKENITLKLKSPYFEREIKTKYLIGCDGALSTIRRKIFPKKIRWLMGMQEITKNSINLKNTVFIYDNEICDSYSWLIPKDNKVIIGSGLEPKEAKQKFGLLRRKIRGMFGKLENGMINGWPALNPNSISDIFLGKDNILLAGEAAGLISPTSSEGISFALESGKYCAEAINESCEDLVERYSKKCESLVKRISEKLNLKKMKK